VQLQREIEELHASLDHENKVKQDSEKLAKNFELQVHISNILSQNIRNWSFFTDFPREF